MLRCLAGVCCCGSEPRPQAAPAAEENWATRRAVREIVKPILRLDEEEAPAASSLSDLAERLSLVLAPPGAAEPLAVVSEDFPRNVSRLLVLLPSPGAPPGAWDTSAGQRGNPAAIFRWGKANGWAVCLFSAPLLEADPSGTWDKIVKFTPAGSCVVLAAAGALTTFARALLPSHKILYSRFRVAMAPFEGSRAWPPTWPAGLNEELVKHLANCVHRVPSSWASEEVREDPRLAIQLLFERLEEHEQRFQSNEARKYAGFQNLKENDMPGLKRLPVEQRISRLNRDRRDDELARLLKENEPRRLDDGEESEPGVD